MEVGTGCYFSFDSNVLFSYKTTLALNVILSAWWSRSGSWLGLGALFSLGGGVLFCLGVLFGLRLCVVWTGGRGLGG